MSEDQVPAVRFSEPAIGDGGDLWRLAGAAGELDVNSSYAYLLWCRDFAATSVIARTGEGLAGFVTGYRRADAPDVLMVWQVAVDGAHRGQGIAGRMLDHLARRLTPAGVRWLETTITPGNEPSHRLFGSFATGWGATLTETDLFESAHFPDGHDPEHLIRIGPLESG